ncbi:MAG: HAD-IB family hydrolase [Pseudomonadales bacterium]|nr:HAD-IB family hydrolase [Pseudomonadales bacterium]
MKKIAFFDLDKTIYNGSSMESFLFEYLIPNRKIRFIELIETFVLIFRYKFRLISHNQASKKTIEMSAKVLAGKSVSEVDSWLHNFFTKKRTYSYVSKLFFLLEQKNYEIFIISASIEPVVSAFANIFGVKSYSSNLFVNDNLFTGRIKQLMNEGEKAKIVKKISNNSKTQVFSIGFGDSSGDIEMLKAVNYGFLFEPFEKNIIKIAKKHKITLVDRKNILRIVEKILDLN